MQKNFPWQRVGLLLLLLSVLLQLVACGASSWRKGGVPGSKPYTVRGKTYYPLKSAHGFIEEGVASWYGPGFHGKKTANGETYDQYGLTAAHKILPLGTTVKVTNLSNRKSIIVRINDRGPFVDDRVIDLSRKGAELLGVIAKGTARVRVQSVGSIAGSTEDGDIFGKFYVQVGTFASLDAARSLMTKLHKSGFSARYIPNALNGTWNVQVGPWPDVYKARDMLPRLTREYKGAFVVSE